MEEPEAEQVAVQVAMQLMEQPLMVAAGEPNQPEEQEVVIIRDHQAHLEWAEMEELDLA
jgi:hypothetical protein